MRKPKIAGKLIEKMNKMKASGKPKGKMSLKKFEGSKMDKKVDKKSYEEDEEII